MGPRILAALLALAAGAAAQPVRTLIFSGRNNHDWRTTTPYLKQMLADSGRFDVRVDEAPAGATERTLADFDLLVLDYNGLRWGPETERAVESFVKSGKGLLVVHGADYAFSGLMVLGDHHVPTGIVEPPWPPYAAMIGGVWGDGPPKTSHGARHTFAVRFVDREHPVARGMGESFLATDELYHQMKMRPEAHVIAAAYDDPAFNGTGRDEPILWSVAYGKGRVFHTTLGHNTAALWEPGFRSTFLRGAEWAATGAVTLPPVSGPPAPPRGSVRTLVVTGGHPYDAEFYSLFEGVDWTHAVFNTEAFREDLRPKYDLLVLYDFESEIGETQRRNLRDFVEAGKGLLVLHHAIADYNAWTWWWQEVVGGRYLLKPDAGMPASTYRHGQEQRVRPVGTHPITARVGPLHLWDETYHGMWISPGVKVLLQSDSPDSDGPVAWVSPYDKSRVVYLQLGHDRVAFGHPGYRELVRNAMLWCAGKLR